MLVVRAEFDNVIHICGVPFRRSLDVSVGNGVRVGWLLGKGLFDVFSEENNFVEFSVHKSVKFLALI